MHCNLKARIKLFRLLLQSFSTSLWFAELMVEMKGYKVAALVFKYSPLQGLGWWREKSKRGVEDKVKDIAV